MIFVSCCWQVWFSWQGGLEEVPRICNLQILQIQRTVGRSARNWLVFYNVQRKELSSTSLMKTATSRQPNLSRAKEELVSWTRNHQPLFHKPQVSRFLLAKFSAFSGSSLCMYSYWTTAVAKINVITTRITYQHVKKPLITNCQSPKNTTLRHLISSAHNFTIIG